MSSTNLDIVVSKLPPNLKEQWFARQRYVTDSPLKAFEEWLAKIAECHLQMLATQPKGAGKPGNKDQPKTQKVKTNVAATGKQRPPRSDKDEKPKESTQKPGNDWKCPLDGAGHPLHECPAFKAKPVAERANIARESKLCFRCLRPGHIARNCTTNSKECSKEGCKGKHHQLLHGAPVIYPMRFR